MYFHSLVFCIRVKNSMRSNNSLVLFVTGKFFVCEWEGRGRNSVGSVGDWGVVPKMITNHGINASPRVLDQTHLTSFTHNDKFAHHTGPMLGTVTLVTLESHMLSTNVY